MDAVCVSSSELADSLVCQICRGYGDLKNPRGVVVETQEENDDMTPRGRYAYIYVHHPNLGSLLNSATAGCGMCKLLLDGLRSHNRAHFPQVATAFSLALETAGTQAKSTAHAAQFDDNTSIATHLAALAKPESFQRPGDLHTVGHGRVAIRLFCKDKTGPRQSKHQALAEVYVLSNPPLTTHVVYFDIPDDPLDPELKHRPSRDLLSGPHIGLIHRWMNTCEREHGPCRKSTRHQPLPSRVLELLDLKNEKNGVRLIEPCSQTYGEYARLSYCWGTSNSQIGQTTHANLLKQQQGIAFQDLPNTVLDAIYLCHMLGFRFLWVDRLCIIQDDEKDWSIEASRMCDIYSRSALTLSVPICNQSSQSFLGERHRGSEGQSQFCTVTYEVEESRWKGSFCITPRPYDQTKDLWVLENTWSGFCYKQNDARNNWWSRGWTFQEWMLSPRVLHIDSMTLWDCFNGYANELIRRQMEKPNLLRDPKELGRTITWESILVEYSKREVTFEKDRFPALAGLAARYRQITGYTYLAGLWLEEMPKSLLWGNFAHSFPNYPRLAQQSAPSWSWASWNEPVKYGYFDIRKFSARASIVGFGHRNKPLSPTSMVEEAWIDVEGCLSVVMEQSGFTVVAGNERWSSFPDNGNGYPDDAIAEENVYLLILGVLGESQYCRALVLRRCGLDNGRPWFRRLGLAETWRGAPPPHLEPLWQQGVIRLV